MSKRSTGRTRSGRAASADATGKSRGGDKGLLPTPGPSCPTAGGGRTPGHLQSRWRKGSRAPR
eukprot:3640990-Pleurochrysis_carterae.AAC.4